MAVFFGVPFYALMANLCYSLGWVFDLAKHRNAPSKILFKAGLIFSLILTALPGIWTIIAVFISVCTRQKL